MNPKHKPLRIFGVPDAAHERLFALQDERNGFIESRNLDALMAGESQLRDIRSRGGVISRPPINPLPQLVVTHPDFDDDIFMTNGKITYVSRTLRESMAFSESEVRYLPIDDSLSLRRIQEKEYAIIDFLIWEDAADWQRSTIGDWADLFGTHEGALRPPYDPPLKQVVLKEDFEPRSSAFWVVGAGEGPFITADKARRIEHLPALDLRQPITLVD